MWLGKGLTTVFQRLSQGPPVPAPADDADYSCRPPDLESQGSALLHGLHRPLGTASHGLEPNDLHQEHLSRTRRHTYHGAPSDGAASWDNHILELSGEAAAATAYDSPSHRRSSLCVVPTARQDGAGGAAVLQVAPSMEVASALFFPPTGTPRTQQRSQQPVVKQLQQAASAAAAAMALMYGRHSAGYVIDWAGDGTAEVAQCSPAVKPKLPTGPAHTPTAPRLGTASSTSLPCSPTRPLQRPSITAQHAPPQYLPAGPGSPPAAPPPPTAAITIPQSPAHAQQQQHPPRPPSHHPSHHPPQSPAAVAPALLVRGASAAPPSPPPQGGGGAGQAAAAAAASLAGSAPALYSTLSAPPAPPAPLPMAPPPLPLLRPVAAPTATAASLIAAAAGGMGLKKALVLPGGSPAVKPHLLVVAGAPARPTVVAEPWGTPIVRLSTFPPPGGARNGGGGGAGGGGVGLVKCKSLGPGRHPHDAVDIKFEELQMRQQIGEGGFGKVYLGTWRGEAVAIKLANFQAHGSLASQQQLADEFHREVHTMSTIPDHPNVLRLLGACTQPPHLALVTEYCAQGSLYYGLHTPGVEPLPLQQLLAMCLGIARGMWHLHVNHILHRDLKSANLLLDDQGAVKICDFGLSRIVKEWLPMTGGLGTYQWMAPEVLAHQRYSEKADVYSFAIVMYELLTRQMPYLGMTAVQAAIGVVNYGLRPVLPYGAPPQLAALIAQCWAAVPDQRPRFDQIIETLSDMLGRPALAAAAAQ